MVSRWFLINLRYLSISVTIAGPDFNNPEDNVVLAADVSFRPLFAWHCASIWSGLFRCENFVFLWTTFARFDFLSDHLDVYDDLTLDPSPTRFLDFADELWCQCARAAAFNLNPF